VNVGLPFNGTAPDLGCFETTGTNGIVESKSEIKISKFQLSQNYPNPFNPETKITYELSVSSLVKVSVYDLLGREIVVLVDGKKTAGRYSVIWDAKGFTSGMYFSRLECNGEQKINKMILLK
jgi:hypothetical protein